VGKVCPICKSSDLSPDWSSSVLVVDPTNSVVARSLGIKEKGKYALKVT
jgi:DNA-directed RNA polymerase subunit E"